MIQILSTSEQKPESKTETNKTKTKETPKIKQKDIKPQKRSGIIGRPPKTPKVKKAEPIEEPEPEPAVVQVTPTKEEEKEPVIIIRKKTPIKKKPKSASKRQHSLAAKKRWIARKAKQEDKKVKGDPEERYSINYPDFSPRNRTFFNLFRIFFPFCSAMEVDDVQMPQLCPVTEVETENQIYNNPPVLDKKPESDSHDEEPAPATTSAEIKDDKEDENDDEKDGSEPNVQDKPPSGNDDSYQPEKMDTSEEVF